MVQKRVGHKKPTAFSSMKMPLRGGRERRKHFFEGDL